MFDAYRAIAPVRIDRGPGCLFLHFMRCRCLGCREPEAAEAAARPGYCLLYWIDIDTHITRIDIDITIDIVHWYCTIQLVCFAVSVYFECLFESLYYC